MESIITVSKSTKLCIAHRLMFHKGKCKNLHGHNYKVTATFCAKEFTSKEGMVIDFGVVKNTVFKMLDDAYDHTTFLYDKDPLADVLKNAGVPVVRTPTHPTAENMCYMFCLQINNILLQLNNGVYCTEVTVEETEGAKANLIVDASLVMQEIKDAIQSNKNAKKDMQEEQDAGKD